ncbi:MAG: pentapeptide repeat-containing protein, partial [Nostocaceae cyanobacterium]|nr:pentapeptide repeat-containing protein [Nostocaceae cyanobacterium]
MANPSVRRSSNSSNPAKGQGKIKTLPIVTRRCAAWLVEVTLVAASGLVPYSIGVYANTHQLERVPINPVLVATEETFARTLSLPIADNNRQVAPLANLFWSAGLVAPLLLSGWQFYLLATTGSTLPKRWFGVKVVTAAGKPPGLTRVLVREVVGRWGLPLSLAFFMWRYTGAFPNLGILMGLAGFLVLGEGISYPFHKDRRSLHDRLAGTYAVDAYRPFVFLGGKGNGRSKYKRAEKGEQWVEGDEDAAIASIVISPEPRRRKRTLWRWMRQNPGMTLIVVGLLSMAAVSGSLIGTQIYVQSQLNQRSAQQRNSEQFLALVKKVSPESGSSLEDRRAAILALATLNDAQSIKFLVELLGQETNPQLLDTIQQALASNGLKAMPYLQRLNQSLSNELQAVKTSGTPQERELRLSRLQNTQQAIAKILVVYSGKNQGVDLSRTELGQNMTGAKPPFFLVLDKVDLSGVKFTSANLNRSSFRGTRFRGVGEDGRYDTFDDWIADLSGAKMQQTNLTDANLSRVMMNRTDLSRATLNRANLASARMNSANLSSAQLVAANMRDAVLENAKLTGADLGEANLQEANLFAARLSRAIALGTKLSFANLTKSDWQAADLSGADLSRANLRSANLSATRL